MDPTACLARILELQAELTQLGEQHQYSTGNKLRNSGHPAYEEWKECWDNLIDWLINGGFAPTLESLEPAGKVKIRKHGVYDAVIKKQKWIERVHIYSGRDTAGRQASIYKNDSELEEEAPHVLFIYNAKGNLIGTWNLFPK